mmetsp:Transcript_26007/g.77104  ORF Transcript_26007/g.77104 Transcript_26007/m.77104 type:complete len:224 (+) Transcript_26007:1773-2444(+)
MGNFTSSSKKPKASAGITELDRTVLSLKTQRNKLNDQMKLLDKRVDRHQEVARELIKEGRKDRALLALKKKKMATMQQEQVASHVLHIESMLSNIETSKQQTALFKVLQEGNEQLKAIQKLVTVEDVEKLMEDTAEAQAYQDELNRALGVSLSGVDDAAVEAEFEILEAEEAVATAASMPSAPTERPAEQQLPAVPMHPADTPADTPAEEDEQPEQRQAMLAT